MKKSAIIFLVMVSSLAALSQDKTSAFSPLLSNYLLIKNALVKGDVANAAEGANGLILAVNAVDNKSLSAAEQTAFRNVQTKLLSNANIIAAGKDLAKQRVAFQALSDNMITLSKATQSANVIYVDYCPMKKAYWLSEAKEIKNPYFGNAMLTCGELKEALQ